MDYYRLDVVTENVQEAIQHAGGLMFDRRRAGWRVAVVTDDTAHPRALAILGIRSRTCRHPDDEQFASERGCRTTVSRLGEFGHPGIGTPMLCWEQPAVGGQSGDLQQLAHPLSAAARAFKAQALRCIGLDAEIAPHEHFWVDATAAAGPFGRSRSSTVVGGWPGG